MSRKRVSALQAMQFIMLQQVQAGIGILIGTSTASGRRPTYCTALLVGDSIRRDFLAFTAVTVGMAGLVGMVILAGVVALVTGTLGPAASMPVVSTVVLFFMVVAFTVAAGSMAPVDTGNWSNK